MNQTLGGIIMEKKMIEVATAWNPMRTTNSKDINKSIKEFSDVSNGLFFLQLDGDDSYYIFNNMDINENEAEEVIVKWIDIDDDSIKNIETEFKIFKFVN
jgi:hypothetical protein